jgi:hypothetical protein
LRYSSQNIYFKGLTEETYGAFLLRKRLKTGG